jgi:membrane protein YqaA with SNARE-associated domain
MMKKEAIEKIKNFNKKQINTFKEINRKGVASIKNIKSKYEQYSERRQKTGIWFWSIMLSAFFFVLIFMASFMHIIRDNISAYGYPGIFIMTFIIEFFVQPIGPDIPLVFGIFFLRNPWITFLCVLVGSNLALLVAYYIGKNIGAPGVESIVGKKKFQKVKEASQKGKWFLLIGAISPVPYIPYLAGFWELSFKETMLYVAIPRTIRFIVVALMAYYFSELVLSFIS